MGDARADQDGVPFPEDHLHSDHWQRTVHIDTLDVGTIDFEISPERQDALVEQGILETENYFSWCEDPAEAPVNRMEEA